MKRFGLGLSSLALGIAVEVSDLHGGLYEVLAWGAFAVGGVLVVVSIPGEQRRGRKPDRSGANQALSATELLELGREILRFVRQRGQEGPSGIRLLDGDAGQEARTPREERALREYEADTLAMYFEQFDERVELCVNALEGTAMGRLEGNRLLSPETVEDVYAVGTRLRELAKHVRSHRRRQVA